MPQITPDTPDAATGPTDQLGALSHASTEELRQAELDLILNEPPAPISIDDLEPADYLPDVPRHSDGYEPGLIRLSDVRAEKVDWIWRGRIPRGKVIIVEGDPKVGKSILCLEIAARLSVGDAMFDPPAPPDRARFGELGEVGEVPASPSVGHGDVGNMVGEVAPIRTLYLTAEDGAGDTLRPRFAAAGGNPEMLTLLESVPVPDKNDENELRYLPPSFPRDSAYLDHVIDRYGIGFVVIDVLAAHMDENLDAAKDSKMRTLLTPLKIIAEKRGVTIVIIRHFNKSATSKSMMRGGGSVGIAGAARVILQVHASADDPERRILAVAANNLSEPPPSLIYQIVGTDVEVDGIEISTALLQWVGVSLETADSLSTHDHIQQVNPSESSSLDDAERFILDDLQGGPLSAKELERHAKEGGHATKTFQRARSNLKKQGLIEPHKSDDEWRWQLNHSSDAS